MTREYFLLVTYISLNYFGGMRIEKEELVLKY
jgi:hypothetical protein